MTRPLSWFLRSTCHRYRIDSNLSHGKRTYVVWLSGTREPERLGEWPTAEAAKAACAAHAEAAEVNAEREWSEWKGEAR